MDGAQIQRVAAVAFPHIGDAQRRVGGIAAIARIARNATQAGFASLLARRDGRLAADLS